MAGLVAIIAATPDSPTRDYLVDLYRAANVDRFGTQKADWYRKEYEWLRANPQTARLIRFPLERLPKPTS